ncbi:hypothetical protein [Virgibacillus sp. YIM 98842]|jgi:hypothetical protein|uniref:hypothetical protein n=1 Tax=Virgibacillus sp. YIM 98842 TaxID=2663533 RepID=UPI0013D9F1DE|nr:hypothetical protein [Virgibacillus sp. YIM 98842]
MKTGLAMLALLGLIILVGFLDSPANWEDHEGVNLMNDLAQDEKEASTQFEEENIPAFSSVEMVLEDTTEDDGYIVEVYREYEIYTDEHGTITKREPTDNYDYLRYKIDGEHEHDHEHDHE